MPSPKEGIVVEYPLSQDEHAAMARYISGIRKQLQDVSDLFSSRYGKQSNISEIAIKTLASVTLLEHELLLLDNSLESLSNEMKEEFQR